MRTLYSINEVTIVPAPVSSIRHRSECNPFYEGKKLPLFSAPMSCVINEENYKEFEKVGINTILPRNISLDTRYKKCINTFCAFGLEEAKSVFLNMKKEDLDKAKKENKTFYVCIDIANGHMEALLVLCKKLKCKFGQNIKIMTGNIARPSTYIEYAKVGIDYVRVGIGSGNVCTTSANVGVHYPMASLIKEIKIQADSLKFTHIKHRPLIVADGGFKNFDQINKALALGADYVMLGEILAKSEEACGEINHAYMPAKGWSEEDKKHLVWDEKNKCFYLRMREYYGMSTKQAQIEFGKKGDKTAEGISKTVYIDYPIAKWVDNFKAYLQSAMSYTNCKTLEEFKSKATCELMTPSAYNSYFK